MNVSVQRILFPTDFSPASHFAKQYACAIAGPLNAELHVLHVTSYPHVESRPTDSWLEPQNVRLDALLESAKEQLDQEMKNSLIRDVQIHKVVRVGETVQEILNYANEQRIELIVLGTHGRTGLEHIFIGSVAEQIVQKANCPVLTVRPQGHQILANEQCHLTGAQ